jgi:hypothetical protein
MMTVDQDPLEETHRSWKAWRAERPSRRAWMMWRSERRAARWMPSNRVLFWTLIANAILVLGLVQILNTKVDTNQAQTQSAGDSGRAALCQVLIDLGDDITNVSACQLPGVKAQLDTSHPPTAGANSPGQVANRRLLCDVLAHLDEHPSECSSIPSSTR